MSDQPASVMLARTPLSATETHHYSHGLYSVWPKVYFQDPQGQIRTVNGNEGGASTVAVPKANLNNQFAAISWGGPESGVRPEERVYYTDRSGQIYEHCWSNEKGWYPGELSGQYKAATYSALAVATYSYGDGNMHHIQLYYQDPVTAEICELVKNGNSPWVQGMRHPEAMRGTSIAVASTGEGSQLWYQTPDTKFVQWWFEAGKEWKQGNFISDREYDPCASISVASRYRVFTVTRDNELALTTYSDGNWQPSKTIISQIPFAATAGISHPKHYSNTFIATVYTQKQAGQITKVQFNWDNTWEESTLPVTLS